MLDKLEGRNGSAEFARRSMKNLKFVIQAPSVADVHPVTQTVIALLGIVVFPWERSALHSIKKIRLEVAAQRGLPAWQMSGKRVQENKVKNLGNLLVLLRNALAHGHVTFDSDSKVLSEVCVRFENIPRGSSVPDWRASIGADELVEFCEVFSSLVESYVS